MKTRDFKKNLLLLMSGMFLISGFWQTEALEIKISDINLETVIRFEIGKPTGPLTTEDLWKVTELEVRNREISDLTGLEHCVNLTYLDLGDNVISDISAFAGLTQLNELKLAGNRIIEISPLAGLTGLKTLDMSENRISDISSLVNLTNLTWLNLNKNQIENISSLGGLRSLRDLMLRSNKVGDIGPLANLVNLRSLDVNYNLVRDASPLSELTGLTTLRIGSNLVRDISPLVNLTNLTGLSVFGLQLSDISPLKNLVNLRWLDLDTNRLTDISLIAAFTNLDWLSLYSNQIRDISPLENLTKLQWLKLYNNKIRDISPLANLTNLDFLDISANLIIDISPLSGLDKLTSLNLSNNQITDIGSLKALSDLTKLYLNNNQISDIRPLEELTNLLLLEASHNQINDISPIENLTKLRELRLNNNQIAELQPLVSNPGLDIGDIVEVRENPLSGISLNLHIPALRTRGVNVLFDPGPPNPPIKILLIPLQTAGEAFWVDIYVGTEEIPVKELFGISVKLKYTNTEFVDIVSPASESVVPGNLMGPDVIFFSNVDDEIGQIVISVTRKSDTGGVEGYGVLARIRMVASSSAMEDISIELNLTDVQAQDPDGNRIWLNPESATVGIRQGGMIVWPGDTDNSGIVDERDVLPIGMYWAKTGPARSPASVTWAPQTASTWTPSAATYADANGDGVVDERDVLPIGMNWQKTHEVPSGAPMLDIASIDHSQYIDAYRTLLTAFESSPKTEPALRMAGLLREMIRQSIPKKTMVFQNYPNPFNPETWIPFQLAEDTVVKIAIYNASGMLVRTMDLGYREAGIYTDKTRAAYWDGMNDAGEKVTSGVYFCRIQLGDLVTVKKIVLAK